jgi:osmoprotectant transport system ATP-binding protein
MPIRIEKVEKRFGATVALDSFSLTIAAGETAVLLGPSGSGKSTVIRIINGLLAPDSGAVWVDGQQLTPGTRLQLRRRMGYVIQDGGLFPHLTARQNATLMAGYLRWARHRIDSEVRRLAELTGLSQDALDRYPLQLSGGQNQRVGLMRALMLDPDILLLDEPLAALDPLIRVQLQRDLKDIFRRLGKTVVLVTHDIAEAAFFGGRIVLMKMGAIVQQGSFRELIDRPADPFVTQFIQAQRAPLDIGNPEAP